MKKMKQNDQVCKLRLAQKGFVNANRYSIVAGEEPATT